MFPPDGKRLLITVSDGYSYDRKWLVLVNLNNGKQRMIGKNTRSGSFHLTGAASPMSRRRATAVKPASKPMKRAASSRVTCLFRNLDGSGKRRLTRSRAAEENPDWSPTASGSLSTPTTTSRIGRGLRGLRDRSGTGPAFRGSPTVRRRQSNRTGLPKLALRISFAESGKGKR